VILGINQVEGLDYTKTLALVARMVIMPTFLVIAPVRN